LKVLYNEFAGSSQKLELTPVKQVCFGNTFKKGERPLITGVPKTTVYSQPGRFNRFLTGFGSPLPLKKREVTAREG